MKVYNKDFIKPSRKTAVALGNFDGVHRGHAEIIQAAVSAANERDLFSVVYTFDRHPENILSDKTVTPVITSNEIKTELIEQLGVDILFFEYFDKQLASLSPEEFVRAILVDKLQASVVVCGFNYYFGHCGSGDTGMLKTLCAERGIETIILPPVTENAMVISSTTIRAMIAAGNIACAAQLCGHPFRHRSVVEPGKKLGRTLGFPTANQRFSEDGVTPQFAVYLTIAEIDGVKYRGVTNVGVRPTVDDGSPNLETHIIGYSGDAYGKILTLDFIEKIRPERRFSSLQELKTQVEADIKYAKEHPLTIPDAIC